MRVLLVDDEQLDLDKLCEIVGEILPEDELNAFTKPRQASVFAKNNRIDIAFLDINMPFMDGIILAKDIKEYNPCVNIIFCTAHSEYMAEAFKMHASGYIVKPITKPDIISELDALRYDIVPIIENDLVHINLSETLSITDKSGNPIEFKRKKTEHLLIILAKSLDEPLSSEQLCQRLWDDNDKMLKSNRNYLRQLLSDLRKELSKIGAEDILIKDYNGYSLDKNKIIIINQ